MNIDRINELARKQKTVGLTPEEKEEQARLRAEYIENIRAGIRAQMDNVDIVQEDGSVLNAGEEHRRKYGN